MTGPANRRGAAVGPHRITQGCRGMDVWGRGRDPITAGRDLLLAEGSSLPLLGGGTSPSSMPRLVGQVSCGKRERQGPDGDWKERYARRHRDASDRTQTGRPGQRPAI